MLVVLQELSYNNPYNQAKCYQTDVCKCLHPTVNYPPTPKAMCWASCFADKGNPSSPQAWNPTVPAVLKKVYNHSENFFQKFPEKFEEFNPVCHSFLV